jgi:hypothetical protein
MAYETQRTRQRELAAAAGLSEVSIKNAERAVVDSRGSTLNAIQRAFDRAGVIFWVASPSPSAKMALRLDSLPPSYRLGGDSAPYNGRKISKKAPQVLGPARVAASRLLGNVILPPLLPMAIATISPPPPN